MLTQWLAVRAGQGGTGVALQDQQDFLLVGGAQFGQAKEINQPLKVFAVLTMCPSNPAITEVADAQAYLARVSGLQVIEPCVFDRKVYRDAICAGKGATEMTNDKAKAELVAVWSAING